MFIIFVFNQKWQAFPLAIDEINPNLSTSVSIDANMLGNYVKEVEDFVLFYTLVSTCILMYLEAYIMA